MATKKETTEVKETIVEEVSTPKVDPFEELVPFYAFKDSGKYQDDLTVCINGKGWKIQRGQNVMIPRKVLFVLEQSRDQDALTAGYIAQQEELRRNANF